MCANYYSNICIMTIKIDQNKFYHFNPLTEMTGSAVKRENSMKGNLTERVKFIYGKSHKFVGQ